MIFDQPVKLLASLTVALATALLSTAAHADVRINTGFDENETAYIQFLDDIQFTISADTTKFYLLQIKDAWTTSRSQFTTEVDASTPLLLNGSSGSSYGLVTYIEGLAIASLSDRDSLLTMKGGQGTFSEGEIATIHAGTYYLPGLTQIFESGNYNLYLIDSGANTIASAGTAVPEPSTWACMAAGLTGFVFLRRRAVAAR